MNKIRMSQQILFGKLFQQNLVTDIKSKQLWVSPKYRSGGSYIQIHTMLCSFTYCIHDVL